MSHLANPPFNDSDTALRACAFPRSGATVQLVSAAKDHFRKERAEQVNKRDFAEAWPDPAMVQQAVGPLP